MFGRKKAEIEKKKKVSVEPIDPTRTKEDRKKNEKKSYVQVNYISNERSDRTKKTTTK